MSSTSLPKSALEPELPSNAGVESSAAFYLSTPHLKQQRRFEVHEGSQIAETRRICAELARHAGFGEAETGKVSLAVTEAATNLLKHAHRGELLVRVLERPETPGLELIALDYGPGIADVRQSLRDGFSTAGSSGTGLGALSRLADQFDIYSLPGKGTVLRVAFCSRALRSVMTPPMELGVVCQAKSGEEVSGDDWGFETHQQRYVFTVVDGLGHGPDAHRAARCAIEALHLNAAHGPARIIEKMHDSSRATRGSAVGVCELDVAQRLCRFAGVGNIGCAIVAGSTSRHLVSHNGIVGHSMRKLQEFTAPWPDHALLIMHSDGVATQWDVAAYPGLSARHPALIAAVLYRDFCRQRDDATVLVAKQAGTP